MLFRCHCSKSIHRKYGKKTKSGLCEGLTGLRGSSVCRSVRRDDILLEVRRRPLGSASANLLAHGGL